MGSSDEMSFPDHIPPEVQAQMRAQYETQLLTVEENVRRQEMFFENLSGEDLQMFRGLLRASLNDPSFGYYIIGWSASLLKYQHNICQVCGKKHETAEDMLLAHSDSNSDSDSDTEVPND